MAQQSGIEWTESTWNPVTGCNKVSPGCKNCYAETMAKRLQAMGQENYKNGFELTLQPHMLERPLEWKTPQTIFVNSMSDLFHEDVPLDYIKEVFRIMNEADWHHYQILTKRANQLAEYAEQLPWQPHIWMGVSVETALYQERIELLRQTPAMIKFLSFEPLLGPLPDLDLHGIDWVIVGGESGPGSRPMKEEWVIEIRNQCQEQDVPFFFKQWGGVRKHDNGRELEGQIWNEMPESVVA